MLLFAYRLSANYLTMESIHRHRLDLISAGTGIAADQRFVLSWLSKCSA